MNLPTVDAHSDAEAVAIKPEDNKEWTESTKRSEVDSRWEKGVLMEVRRKERENRTTLKALK